MGRRIYLAYAIFIGTALFRFGSAPAFSEPPGPQIYYFYAEDCQPCQVILKDYLPTLKTMFPSLDVKVFDVANPSYYQALSQLEKRSGRAGMELPVVFIGDQLLSGEQEVMEKLNPLLLEYQAKGGIPLPPIEILSIAKPSEKKFATEMVYFYQKGCPKCDRANSLLHYLLKKYPHLTVKEVDLNSPDGKRLNEALSNRLQLPAEKRLIAPSLFMGKDYLSPEQITESKVEGLIHKYGQVSAGIAKPEPAPAPALTPTPEEVKKAEESLIERFRSLGILTVASAGLIDGVNPCAFATLIFFISYLSFVGRKRNEILWVGIGFSGSVFLTYLLIGFGILSFIQHFSFLPLFSRIVYLLTIAIALTLAIYSLYDYVLLKKGRPSEMKLQLPDFLKKRIHQAIREKSHSTHYFLAAVTAGLIISLLEFTCTGQVYLPTILFVTNVPAMRTSAISYLILYNLMFITPLLIIFAIVYWGVTSEQLALFLQKRAATIKLLTSLLFFLLAGLLMVSLP
jgi:thiol-disulfide isomerase/thioredoxin